MKILAEGFSNPISLSTETSGDGKSLFIKGIYAQAGVQNKNGRIYSEEVMDGACRKFDEQYIKSNRGVGELNHPQTLAIDLERVCHKIVSLEKDGQNYVGKARVLDTASGKNLAALIEGGVVVGVSTRGFGSTVKRGTAEHVGSDFTIIAIDAVFHPSAPDALVKGIMEGKQFITEATSEDAMFLESIKTDVVRANRALFEEEKLRVFAKFLKRFVNI